MGFRELTKSEHDSIVNKQTERPYSGEYVDNFAQGYYVCKRCGAKLFRSEDKFQAFCGWPSFDDAVEGAIKLTTDPDGDRTEVSCVNCGAHLGHTFMGEGFTDKNVRHCVNSISLIFVPQE